MLIYHPAYDAYHCLFRMIAIVDHVQELEVDKARILDFYMIFPSLIQNIRMPVNYSQIKKLAKLYHNQYHDPISQDITFKDMYQIQLAAIKCLAATGLIVKEKLNRGLIYRTNMKIPDELLISMKKYLERRDDINSFIIEKLSQFHLFGKDGLKDRTGLMEYRYDFS
ncbi:ABC-three component system middle component 5 [Providencia sp. JUb39]|uniref:ABC-three component system middle component 5 n=1 Tax=Providencia sp. JUb39 TaxID=2724165 RepID=UPI00164D9DA8|nr:ABC-three component system middle component 5 [Providencia sp. JUb39]MBC5788732.1 hypothetical protein [Providencia sp. JUb39]